jgi:hypothetical protein
MEDILNKLHEWKGNTDFDIKQDWITDEERMDAIRQSISLATSIGILENLGNNRNIPSK